MAPTPDLPHSVQAAGEDSPIASDEARTTRQYKITEGGDTIKAIGAFELVFIPSKDRPNADADEKRCVGLINGAIANISDKFLQNMQGASKDNIILSGILKRRPGWIAMLRERAQYFIQPEYTIYNCTKDTLLIIGEIRTTIKHVIETNKTISEDVFAAKIWDLMSKYGRKANIWKALHYILTACSIIGSILGTISVLSDAVGGHRLIYGILLSLPAIAFAIEKGFSVADNAQWNGDARDAYSELRDDFYFKRVSVEQAVEQFHSLRERVARTRPEIARIGEPARPGVPVPRHAPPNDRPV